MLEQIQLTQKLSKQEYRAAMPQLELRLGELQRQCRERQVPVIVVFEGWDAAGKGTLINRLMLALDARGYRVYPINPPTQEERMRPFLWRFWNKTPAKGKIAIFDRSWYGRLLVERVNRLVKKPVWQRGFTEINSFERQLCDDGAALIKIFLHISQKEQKKRYEKLLDNKATAWKVTAEDWRNHRRYEKYLPVIEEMLATTSSTHAPWTIIPSSHLRFATVKVFETVIAALERRLDIAENGAAGQPPRRARHRSAQATMLDSVDLSLDVAPEQYQKRLDALQKRLRELEHEIYLRRIPVTIVYEGWDAAGKGGNIRRLVQGLDPRGFEVIPIGAPNDVEKQHHYLWRFWLSLPKAGHIAIFDRSWYGRVLVERVEGFCREEQWRRAYAEINEMERQWVDDGMVLIKFWLQIDQEEQLRRFKEREAVSYKQWKITEEDWRNRKQWPAYKVAVDEMLANTSTPQAPWTIVEANSKRHARLKALQTVSEAIQTHL